MLKKYTSEQFWKLYEKLPPDLQDAIFSTDTANTIYDICKRNKIEEVSKIADIVGQVLLGVLSPDEIEKVLNEELYIDPETAHKISQEIYRFILYPVKKSLEDLYGIAARRSLRKESEETIESAPISTETKPKTTSKKNKKDLYREPVGEEEE